MIPRQRPDMPSPEDIAHAVASGEATFRGLPVRVTMVDQKVAGWQRTATLDIAAVVRGCPDPWVITTGGAGTLSVETPTARGLYVGGIRVSADDIGHVDAALDATPDRSDRHDELADGMRLQAGQHAMRVSDNVTRSRLLDGVDGWVAIVGDLVNEDPAHGRLHEPAAGMGLTCRLLVVQCPTTSRLYTFRVPASFRRARDARIDYVLGGVEPESES